MRILFLTHRLPYAPNRGDRVRAYHVLQFLLRHAEVELLSLAHDSEEEAHAAELRAQGVELSVARVSPILQGARAFAAMCSGTPLTHALLDAPSMRQHLSRVMETRPPDVVLAYCSGMARFALQPPLTARPFVLDLVDVDSMKWSLLSRKVQHPRRWIYAREALLLGRFEAAAVSQAAETLVVNELEAEAVRQLVPDARPIVVPNGVDLTAFQPQEPPSDRADVVFTGVFNYQPNEDGAVWLARDVWPLVRQARPDARLLLVGASPSRRVRALANLHASIVVTGAVPGVQPYLWQAAVGVGPLTTARGVQNKILEAIAAGLPCVVTPVVFEGIPGQVRRACLVAATTESFASAIVQLLNLPAGSRRNMTRLESMKDLHWSVRLGPLLDILAGAAGTGSKPLSLVGVPDAPG